MEDPFICRDMNTCLPSLAVAIFLALALGALSQEPPSSASQTQRETVKIHPKLAPFVFEIEGKEAGEVTIKISGGPKGYPGQTFTTGVEDEKHIGFGLVDINFDGYRDFRVVSGRGHPANEWYNYWVFEPKSGRFREAPAFDEITGIDPERQVLRSHSNGGNIQHTTDYYRLRGGKPLIFKSAVTGWSQDKREVVPLSVPDHTPVQITRLYIDGKVCRTFYTTEFEP